MHGHKVVRSAEELIDYYEELTDEFPIISIEDPLDEEDWDGWELLTTRLGIHIQLVGDDLFVTNKDRLNKGIQRQAANAILIKVNQIGTLTEAFDAIEIQDDCLPQIRRNRRLYYCGYRCGLQCRPDQNRSSVQVRTCREVQPSAQDRRASRGCGRVCEPFLADIKRIIV